jgi:hypothetical protein
LPGRPRGDQALSPVVEAGAELGQAEHDPHDDESNPKFSTTDGGPGSSETEKAHAEYHLDPPQPVLKRGTGSPPAGVGHTAPVPTRPANGNLLRFGDQLDVQVIGLGGTDGELTPERVAAYLAKYATKSAEDFGLGERRLSGRALSGVGVSAHVARIVRTAWDLGAVDELAGLRRWLHMLGFRGHFFATKSRRYSTTLGAIRRERSDYRRRQVADARPVGIEDQAGEDSTLVVGRWQFAGLGYLTGGDVALAMASAARAREQREVARDNRSDREEDHDG